MSTEKRSLRKLGNKGFSLVELIIVIGIMGVLAVILTPQFTRYLENARVTRDKTTSSELFGIVEAMLADQTINTNFSEGDTITLSDAGIVVDLKDDTASKAKVEDMIKEMLRVEALTADTLKPIANTHEDCQYVIEITKGTGGYYIATVKENWTKIPTAGS